jgi:hypothetical protein
MRLHKNLMYLVVGETREPRSGTLASSSTLAGRIGSQCQCSSPHVRLSSVSVVVGRRQVISQRPSIMSERRFKGGRKCFARVIQPMWALETLPGQGSAACVLARPHSGNKKVKSLCTFDPKCSPAACYLGSNGRKADRRVPGTFYSPCGL